MKVSEKYFFGNEVLRFLKKKTDWLINENGVLKNKNRRCYREVGSLEKKRRKLVSVKADDDRLYQGCQVHNG